MLAKTLVFTVAALFCVRPAATHQYGEDYVTPLWFERMKDEDETGLLKRCTKRTVNGNIPEHGQRCAHLPKVCYFGTRFCDGVGPHPETRCYCDGIGGSETWICESSACPPVNPTSRPTKVDKQTDSANPPAVIADVCPLHQPAGIDLASCTTYGLECIYKHEVVEKDGSPCTETTECSCTTSGKFHCGVPYISCASSSNSKMTLVLCGHHCNDQSEPASI